MSIINIQSYTVQVTVDTSKTIKVMKSLKLYKGDTISMYISNVEILNDSIYSILWIQDISLQNKSTGFSGPIPEQRDIKSGQKYKIPLSITLSNNLKPPYYFDMPISQQSIEVPLGWYIFSLCLTISSENPDILAIVGSETDPEFQVSGLSIKYQARSNKQKKIFLEASGVIQFSHDSYFTIMVKSVNGDTFSILNQSHVFLLPINLITFASGTSLFTREQVNPILSDNNGWKSIAGVYSEGNPYYLNKYISRSKDKFHTPTNGIYFVYAKVTIKPMRFLGTYEEMNIAINHTKQEQSILYENFASTNDDVLTIGTIMELKRGDILQLQIFCRRRIELTENIDFQIVLLQTFQYETYLIAQFNSFNKNWQIQSKGMENKIKSIKSPENGYYLVAVSVRIRIMKDTKKYVLTLYVYVKKEGLNDEASQELGLKVEKYIEARSDTFIFSMQVIGFLEMKKDDEVIIKLRAPDHQDKFEEVDKRLSFISLKSQYNFKTMKVSFQYLSFIEHTNSLGNFQFTPNSGGYKLPKVDFLGPYFLVKKPITLLYDVEVQLESKIAAEYKLCFRIRPRSGLKYISTVVFTQAKHLTILKAIGVVQLHIGETVELMIYQNNTKQNVLCKRSSWTMTELHSSVTSESSQVYSLPDK